MLVLERPNDCYECGRTMLKTKKIHAGKRYCDTCYARLFKRRMCTGCGNYSRLPVFDAKAECDRCVLSRPCVRCARVGRPVGKLTPYGPACNSCAHYFNEPEPCERCCALSTRLVRATVDERVLRCCPPCARSEAKTCPLCRRHRMLKLQADGKSICQRCAQITEAKCDGCSRSIPGGRGKECEDCYWSRTFQKRLMLDANAFGNQAVTADFLEFGNWLANKVGNKKAAISIHSHLKFFLMLDERWRGMPPSDVLLEQVGCEGLRLARVPIRWYNIARNYVIGDQLLKQHVERERIQKIMACVPSGSDKELLTDYLTILQLRFKSGHLKLSSLRGNLSAAADLILLARSDGVRLIEQDHLDRLLKIKPGIACSLQGFVTFCNTRRARWQSLAIDRLQTETQRRVKLETQMIKLAIAANSGRDVQRSWITKSLTYFHRLRASDARAVLPIPDPAGNGWSIELHGVTYWVPDPCHLSLL